MFCGECGAKNNQEDRFCLECGAPLVEESTGNSGNTTTSNVVKKPRKSMPKRNKIIIVVIAVLIVFLGIGYKVGNDMTSPKTIANDYIKAVINEDGEKLYKYLELEGDKTFVTKEIFKELLASNGLDEAEIENYKITDVEYSEGSLTAKVNFTYTTKGSSSESSSSVNLTKQKDKKFLMFDNWTVSDMSSSSMTMKEYTIEVVKGSTVTYAGIELTDKYLDKEESTSKIDVYVLPQVFTTNTTLKSALPSGLVIEETVIPSTYDSYHVVNYDEDGLSEAKKEEIANGAKDALTTIYENAIARKKFSEIKSNFEHENLDLAKLENSYNQFISDLEDASNTLTSIKFTDAVLYEIDLTNDGYLEVQVRVNYDYSVKYTTWDDEVMTHSDSSYDFMTVVLGYDNGSYYLANFTDVEDYFYRY